MCVCQVEFPTRVYSLPISTFEGRLAVLSDAIDPPAHLLEGPQLLRGAKHWVQSSDLLWFFSHIAALKSVSRCRAATACQTVEKHLYPAVTASLKRQRGRECDCAPEQAYACKSSHNKKKALIATGRGRHRHIESSERPQRATDSFVLGEFHK